jgi:hypothetical protein
MTFGVFDINGFLDIFFFDKSMYYIKKRKWAQPLVHWEYTKGTRGKERTRKENLQS